MKFKKIAALYSILVGLSIIGIWLMLYFSFSIPEIANEPRRIIMHIVAEITTGITLIIGGYGLWKNTKWGDKLFFISQGMLIYTLIASLGYYAQSGEYIMVIIFGFLLLCSLFLIIFSFLKN
ncbi:MAG: hypothetical protein Kow00103_09170 [Candidatus Caldatribacteriota bacterium]